MASSDRARRPPWWELATLACWFAVFAALAEYFPRTGDDWQWGTHEGVEHLSVFFQGLNGRYAGDLSILGLTRIGHAAPLIVSAAVCGCLFLALHLSANRTPLGYGLAAVLFLAMPRPVLREGVVWLAGFSNYALASLVLLAFLAVVQAEWHGRVRAPRAARLIGLVLAAFVGQFFMEHVTVCICVVGIVLSLVHRKTRGTWAIYTTTWTVTAVVGAVVMFSNSAYRRAASNGTGYQQVQATSGPHALHDLLVKALAYLPQQTVVLNITLNAVLAVLLLVLALTGNRWRTRAGVSLIALVLVWLVVAYLLQFLGRDGKHVGQATLDLALLAAACMLAALGVAAHSMVTSSQRRWTIYTSILVLVCLVGPLLLVNPVGPRCFLPTYFVLIVSVGAVAAEVREQVPAVRWGWVAANAAAIALVVVLFSIYVSISHANDQRLAHIRAAVRAGETTVTITPLPHTYYLHNGDPFWSVLNRRFKAYYKIPSSVQIVLSPNPFLKQPGKHTLPAP